MLDDKKNHLVRRPSSELDMPGQRASRVRQGMTRDVLARAKAQDVSSARFRIGDHLLRGPDYRQILRWAEAGGIGPEEVLQKLSGAVVEPPYWDELLIEPIAFSMEDGAMISVPWDFDLLPFIPDSWESGLLIREIGFRKTWEKTRATTSANLRPNLPMLKVLSCVHVSLEELDLSKVPKLTSLICVGNNLSDIDLTPVPRLMTLSCTSDELSKLDLSPVPRLVKLNIRANKLSELNLSSVPKLTMLRCVSELLDELDLSPVPRLRELECGACSISELDLSPVPELTKLDISFSSISKLDLTPVPGLTDLDLEGYNLFGEGFLNKLDLTPVPNLVTLNCSDNNFSALDLTPVPKLSKLYCGGNKLTNLDLTSVPRLTGLDCRWNDLVEIDLTPVPGLTELLCDKDLRVCNAPRGLKIDHRMNSYLSRQ